ncbi:MAG: hypothetical protein HC899_22900, partial [Leptolyngbyaceae cyanobacterium SM1_4_3]|nr:hypothetical protein [Leptolyngbyaceae cyanobacterium SM1_4_3]
MAAFILSLYITGVFVAHPLRVSLLAWLVPFLHQSLGMLFLMLLIARIFLLLRLFGHKYSRRSPKVTSTWLQPIILHSSLYFFMLIVPVSPIEGKPRVLSASDERRMIGAAVRSSTPKSLFSPAETVS